MKEEEEEEDAAADDDDDDDADNNRPRPRRATVFIFCFLLKNFLEGWCVKSFDWCERREKEKKRDKKPLHSQT